MARSNAGGTDQFSWSRTATPAQPSVGCFAFWLKTTQTTSNVSVMSHWSTGSRLGFGILLNNTANKLTAVGYPSSTPAGITLISTSNLNDGNWRHVAFNFNRSSGQANALFIDGVSEVSGNSSSNWGNNLTPTYSIACSQLNGFWSAYVGEIAEIGYWSTNLTSDEIAALAKGYAPSTIRPTSLTVAYAPLVRDIHELRDTLASSVTGTSVTDHPRVIGGSV
ncbi:LamG-like jellyroll fold domain-containing protein [Mesorhizobium silamurunense]|uniref:LamG-like jellyroll fold domain-containing protein n=1 Tax=Mesorhizobium silamurunense TaxID=499528 RepID=UPI00177F349B|nr:LamG-like jellyroll fold domain-containing protein [Mesorhizobium silamurunense]